MRVYVYTIPVSYFSRKPCLFALVHLSEVVCAQTRHIRSSARIPELCGSYSAQLTLHARALLMQTVADIAAQGVLTAMQLST